MANSVDPDQTAVSMANSVDPDQTAGSVLGPRCWLLYLICR